MYACASVHVCLYAANEFIIGTDESKFHSANFYFIYFICAEKNRHVMCVRACELKSENSFSTKLNEQFPIKIIRVDMN